MLKIKSEGFLYYIGFKLNCLSLTISKVCVTIVSHVKIRYKALPIYMLNALHKEFRAGEID